MKYSIFAVCAVLFTNAAVGLSQEHEVELARKVATADEAEVARKVEVGRKVGLADTKWCFDPVGEVRYPCDEVELARKVELAGGPTGSCWDVINKVYFPCGGEDDDSVELAGGKMCWDPVAQGRYPCDEVKLARKVLTADEVEVGRKVELARKVLTADKVEVGRKVELDVPAKTERHVPSLRGAVQV